MIHEVIKNIPKFDELLRLQLDRNETEVYVECRIRKPKTRNRFANKFDKLRCQVSLRMLNSKTFKSSQRQFFSTRKDRPSDKGKRGIGEVRRKVDSARRVGGVLILNYCEGGRNIVKNWPGQRIKKETIACYSRMFNY